MKPVIARDESDLFQKDVVSFTRDVSVHPLLNGQLVENISLSGTTVNVPHSLGRTPTGFIVVKKTAQQDVWQDSTSTVDTKSFLPMRAAGAVTVSLWIF